MTGPSHYRQAERLLADCDIRSAAGDVSAADIMAHVAAAQVHATLALAAATAFQASGVPADGATGYEWRQTICAPERQAS
jgi:hypothetical protein